MKKLFALSLVAFGTLFLVGCTKQEVSTDEVAAPVAEEVAAPAEVTPEVAAPAEVATGTEVATGAEVATGN